MTDQDCNLKLKLSKFATYEKQALFELIDDVDVGGTIVPAGSFTDGATLPRWVVFTCIILLLVGINMQGILAQVLGNIGLAIIYLSFIFPPFGKYALAAVLHDHLLDVLPDATQADREMKKALEHLGITKFHQLLMYRFVRLNTFKNKVVGGE